MEGYHEPVLLREAISALEVEDGGWYLDCTLGDGGHSLEILKLGGNIVGVDVDPEALQRAQERFKESGIEQSKLILIQGNFRDIKNLILQTEPGNLKFRGILFDLGASSLQFGSPQRGFSFAKGGSLDMRMDPSLSVSALDLINGLNKGELNELFTKLGEEQYSRAISDAVVLERQVVPIKTTEQLAKIVGKVVGRKKDKIHPATRIFQALRIAVNDELNALREGLPQALEIIEKDGHILVISFHSLEDRIVKNTFKSWQDQGFGQVLTKKPIVASDEEVGNNPRSRSAKMRIFEKL